MGLIWKVVLAWLGLVLAAGFVDRWYWIRKARESAKISIDKSSDLK